MFLHMRAAGEDFSEIVSQNLYRFPGGVTHSFTGTAEERDKLLSIENMFIGHFPPLVSQTCMRTSIWAMSL
uniref:Uncharacterized protein n=1 Tax=Aegilops tauschii subsp. strangulata TaxID=200361 RepID=A0A453BMD5_AEGTS